MSDSNKTAHDALFSQALAEVLSSLVGRAGNKPGAQSAADALSQQLKNESEKAEVQAQAFAESLGFVEKVECDCDKCTAEMVLAPILALLDQAHKTDDGEHYTALVQSARLTAHAMMRLVSE